MGTKAREAWETIREYTASGIGAWFSLASGAAGTVAFFVEAAEYETPRNISSTCAIAFAVAWPIMIFHRKRLEAKRLAEIVARVESGAIHWPPSAIRLAIGVLIEAESKGRGLWEEGITVACSLSVPGTPRFPFPAYALDDFEAAELLGMKVVEWLTRTRDAVCRLLGPAISNRIRVPDLSWGGNWPTSQAFKVGNAGEIARLAADEMLKLRHDLEDEIRHLTSIGRGE